WTAANFSGDLFAGAPFLSTHRARFTDDVGVARNISLPVGGLFFGTLDVDGRAGLTLTGGSMTVNTLILQRNTAGNGSMTINAPLLTSGTIQINNDSTGPIVFKCTFDPGLSFPNAT